MRHWRSGWVRSSASNSLRSCHVRCQLLSMICLCSHFMGLAHGVIQQALQHVLETGIGLDQQVNLRVVASRNVWLFLRS